MCIRIVKMCLKKQENIVRDKEMCAELLCHIKPPTWQWMLDIFITNDEDA